MNYVEYIISVNITVDVIEYYASTWDETVEKTELLQSLSCAAEESFILSKENKANTVEWHHLQFHIQP